MTEAHAIEEPPRTSNDLDELAARAISHPLVTHIYTADPSAHVFDGKIYVYNSHDIDGPTPEDDLGAHFEMRDYRVLKMDGIGKQNDPKPSGRLRQIR